MSAKMEDAVQIVNRKYLQSFRIFHKTNSHRCSKKSCPETGNGTMVMWLLSGKKPHCRGKRKSIHQRYLELFEGFLDKQLLYELHHLRFGSHNSYSKTDVDANILHLCVHIFL